MTEIVQVKNITKDLDSFTLKDITFSLDEGVIMGMIGENGAGKTSIIKCILRIFHINSGEIRVFGMDHVADEVAIKEEIGVVFDDLHMPDNFNAKMVNHFMSLTFKRWDSPYFYELLQQLDVPTNKKIKTFSRGMRMKMSLAMALAHHPKLLILDEPTSGLDPIVRDKVLDLLLRFMDEEPTRSIIFSSHITSDLEKIADTITFVHKGQIYFSKTKDECLFEHGLWQGSSEELEALPQEAIISTRRTALGLEALVLRNKVNSVFQLTQPTIEDIMLFYTKAAAN